MSDTDTLAIYRKYTYPFLFCKLLAAFLVVSLVVSLAVAPWPSNDDYDMLPFERIVIEPLKSTLQSVQVETSTPDAFRVRRLRRAPPLRRIRDEAYGVVAIEDTNGNKIYSRDTVFRQWAFTAPVDDDAEFEAVCSRNSCAASLLNSTSLDSQCFARSGALFGLFGVGHADDLGKLER